MKKNILLALLSIVIALILSEIVLRIVNVEKPKVPMSPQTSWIPVPERIWTEYHPVLGWYHQKNKHAILKLSHIDTDVNTNSQGFRGPREYKKKKSTGTSRIICLGDSFVFGFGVQDNETFSSQLEAKNKNLEILNLGVSAYGIDQILMAYRTLAKDYDADYVLIGIFPEDFLRATRSFVDSGHAKPYFSLSPSNELILHNVPVPPQYQLNTNPNPEVIQHGAIENFLINHSMTYRLSRKALIRLLGKRWRLLDPDTDESWLLGRVILHQLIREIRENNSQPILMIIPPDRWVQTTRKDSTLRSLHRLGKREHVDLIDLTPEFYQAIQKSHLTDYYIENDWHWTRKGHELAADMISRYLAGREQKL